MVKRRKAIPVALTDEQRERLECLWFYFGNHGPKLTPANHSFIQRLLENGIDERPTQTKRTPKSQIPTPECEVAVDAILLKATAPRPHAGRIGAGDLRIISIAEKPPRSDIDSELNATLDDRRFHYRVVHDRLEGDTDTPDAA
jgi:hypothetical protein